MKTKMLFLLFLAAPLILAPVFNINKGDPWINYSKFPSEENWITDKIDSTENSGHIRIGKHIWLMHFFHWWPLEEEEKKVRVEYTSNLLEKLWGMGFSLTGTVGETEINGHPACYADGIFNDMVKTRFIVWNCPESGRQFLSDCNINLALNTPEELFDLQVEVISTSVCCHQPGKKVSNPVLPLPIVHDSLDLSFSIPSNWRSGFYIVDPKSDKEFPGYYKEGISKSNGVIWNLLSDSEKEIHFLWEKANDSISPKEFKKFVYDFMQDTVISRQDSFELRAIYHNQSLNIWNESHDRLVADGEYDLITDIEGFRVIDTTHYIYRAFFWRVNKTDYLLLASMAAHNDIWGISINLAPSELQFDDFINKEVLEGIMNSPYFQ